MGLGRDLSFCRVCFLCPFVFLTSSRCGATCIVLRRTTEAVIFSNAPMKKIGLVRQCLMFFISMPCCDPEISIAQANKQPGKRNYVPVFRRNSLNHCEAKDTRSSISILLWILLKCILGQSVVCWSGNQDTPRSHHHDRAEGPQVLHNVWVQHVVPLGFRADCSRPVLSRLALNLQVSGQL